ncbi:MULTISPECIES: hypothetical protein [unclassified Deinococcus]|uniref:hypothetical protein n=1 Tax=unclassified Deinococcus TaxID=2623546 RepID=UPI001E28E5DE|nr:MULTISPECIES: hypothetical protein [unclassified Deinococcus]MCD0155760.1 hypothetical protein [Deinococcus sp. 6GRE01]MCD0160364.1 hypothetical protein [Deinococcus sp. 6YEL10]MCD0168898.1 hypothetical protein [Deinococcus sp. 23YEL01]MCD0174900.1 hypothetical protein [Deinococcus sp. 14RED07]
MKAPGGCEGSAPELDAAATLKAWKTAYEAFKLAYDTLLNHRLGSWPWAGELWDAEGCAALLADLMNDSDVQMFFDQMPADAPAVRKLCRELEHQTAILKVRTTELQVVHERLEQFRWTLELL